MWATIFGRQSAESPMKSSGNQTTRGVSMYLPATTIYSRKIFRNPNFVNNFSSNLGLVDNSTLHDSVNSCHKFNGEKEKNPVVNPQVKEPQAGKETVIEPEVRAEMCLKSKPTKQKAIVTKGHKINIKKGTKQMGKQSRQNNKLREVRENIEQDLQKQFAEPTMDNSCCESKPAVLCLNDFLKQDTVEDDHLRSSFSSRSRKASFTDSEDSFIMFAKDTNEESVSEDESSDDNEPACRRRKTSLCESEDSFIMFDRGDVESMEEDDSEKDDDDDDLSIDGDELECMENGAVDSSYDEVDCSKADRKKVTFASDDKLCQVHPMIKWSFAYHAARKGQWEMYARDRCRFRDRVFRVECEINRVLNPIHRARIYSERFVNL